MEREVVNKFYTVESWMHELHPDMDLYHVNIYALIYGYASKGSECWITDIQFGDILRCSKSTAKSRFKDLKTWGLIDHFTERKGKAYSVRRTWTLESRPKNWKRKSKTTQAKPAVRRSNVAPPKIDNTPVTQVFTPKESVEKIAGIKDISNREYQGKELTDEEFNNYTPDPAADF